MIHALALAFALLVAGGAQAGVTAVMIVRAPGAASRDSAAVAAVASVVRRALVAAGITVVPRAANATAEAAADARPKGVTFWVDVTVKAAGRVGLVDLRAANTVTSELVTRVSRRAFVSDLPDSAAVAARLLTTAMREYCRPGARTGAQPAGQATATARTPRPPGCPSS